MEKFYEVFPFYLATGMAAKQYWDGDRELVRYYRKAAKIRQDLKNQDAWLQGIYIYQVISNLAPILRALAKRGTKAVPYLDQSFTLNTMQKGEKEQTKQEKQDERAKAYFQVLAMPFNKKFQEEGGGANG